MGPHSNRLLTRYEYGRLVALKPFMHYTAEEKQFFVNLAKEFVDPNLSDCGTCGGGGNAKLLVYGWFNERKERIDALIKEQEKLDAIAQELREADLSILDKKDSILAQIEESEKPKDIELPEENELDKAIRETKQYSEKVEYPPKNNKNGKSK